MTRLRFGVFELDVEGEQLLKDGRAVSIQPQPFKLLCLLAGQAGKLVTREEIRAALWMQETLFEYEQGVHFAIKQVRDALGEDAERPVYIRTVPKRGYKFVAPVSPALEIPLPPPAPTATVHLQKDMWANIVELRLAEQRRGARRRALTVALVVGLLALGSILLIRAF